MPITICETCGSVFRGDRDTCESCGESVPPRDEIRRLPHEVVLSFLEHAEELLASSPLRQAVLAFVAGSFIAFGAVLSVAPTTGGDVLTCRCAVMFSGAGRCGVPPLERGVSETA